MKKLSFALILSFLFINLSLSAQYAYDDDVYDDNFYPGYLGDDFSLEGALEVFKQARSIEDFEFDINNQDRYVNNLDLNNDGRTDFIRVTDQSENRSVRLVVMQAILGRGDVQDVAVIAIEKTGRRTANLQIIGDEYLFGPDMIVEPSDIAYNQNRFDRGPNGDVHISRHFVNVWYWPSVRSLFYSRYTYYRSPYYWGYYPPVWNPWRPFRYATYYDRCGRYRNNYWRTTPTVRIVYFNNYYRPSRRVCSVRVRDRYERNRPYYRGNRGNGGDRAGAGRGGRETYNGPRRSYTQTKPERRSSFDKKREQNVVYNRDNQATSPKRDGRKAESVRPSSGVRKDRDTRVSKNNKRSNDVRTSKAPRSSKYDRPTTEVRKDRNDYSKRPETRTPTKRADRNDSYSKPAPSKSKRGSSYSSKPSKSKSKRNTSSYSSKPSRSSSASKSNKSSRSSASKPAPQKRSSAPKASRKSTKSSSSKSSRSSGRSSSKSSKSTKRGM